MMILLDICILLLVYACFRSSCNADLARTARFQLIMHPHLIELRPNFKRRRGRSCDIRGRVLDIYINLEKFNIINLKWKKYMV
jgi:hypothetical protein